MLSKAFVKATERMSSAMDMESMASANAMESIEDGLLEGHGEDGLNSFIAIREMVLYIRPSLNLCSVGQYGACALFCPRFAEGMA